MALAQRVFYELRARAFDALRASKVRFNDIYARNSQLFTAIHRKKKEAKKKEYRPATALFLR